MSWLLIAILSYFFFSLVSLADRYLLAGPLPSPGAYAFLVNFLGGLLSLLIIPFVDFSVPGFCQLFLSFFAGAVWTLGIFFLFRAIFKSEVSRVVPAIGGFLPLFSFFFSFFFFPGNQIFNFLYLLALIFLVSGGVLITSEKDKPINKNVLLLSAAAAVVLALGFALAKMVYLGQPFINGFIWIRIGGGLSALLLLFSRKVRRAVFEQKAGAKNPAFLPFIGGQVCGSAAMVLQNYSLSLAGTGQIALINALEGVRYVFLLVFILILSRKDPSLFKEDFSPKSMARKILAVLLIAAGLILVALNQ